MWLLDMADFVKKEGKEAPEIGDFLDLEIVASTILEFRPTILSLASCHMNISELNDQLRSHGVYALLIMDNDRACITAGRLLQCDDEQAAFIQKVAQGKPQNLFIWGSQGTGKTILALNCLAMKASQKIRAGIKTGSKLQILVTSILSGQTMNPLLKYMEGMLSHLSHMDQVELCILPLQKMCQYLKMDTSVSPKIGRAHV